MKIFSRIQSYLNRDFSFGKPPYMARQELFQRDGWGPRELPSTVKPRNYKGPLYPEPLHRKATLTSHGTAYCNDARRGWKSGQFQAAEKKYCQAIQADPKNPDFLFEIAQLYLALGRVTDAESALLQAVEIKPDQYRAWVSLARIGVMKRDHTRFDRMARMLRCIDPSAPMSISSACVIDVGRGGI